MLIGICGGICAGKQSVADFLVERYGFQQLYLRNPADAAAEATPYAFPVASASDGDGPGLSASNPNAHGGSSDGDRYPFADAAKLVDFVTGSWHELWLTTDVWDEAVLDVFLRRPFFLLVSIDAPVSTRWERYVQRCGRNEQAAPPLEEFVLQNDDHLFHHRFGLARLIGRAQVRLLNSSSSLAQLHRSLEALDLTDEQRLRPSWDQYFMQLASLAAQRSNCMKRRVGCVLIRERRVISTGYNGTPRGIRNCNEGGCARCNDGHSSGVGLATCLCIHAEENALLEAGRDRIREGSILYCDTCPCLTCSIKITQVGISEVVFSQSYSMDKETAAVFKEGGVRLRQFSPPRDGLIDLSQTVSAASRA